MALNVTVKTRIFKYGDLILSDPNKNMTISEALKFYSMQYPELTTATIEGPAMDNDNVVYTFSKSIGVKG